MCGCSAELRFGHQDNASLHCRRAFRSRQDCDKVHGRSAAQQFENWDRIGGEQEASPVITHGAINNVLSGPAPYDGLPDRAQGVIRAAWDEQISARIAGLNFEERLQEAGPPWLEADDDGNAVVRGPDATPG
jgi:hypothetical protein